MTDLVDVVVAVVGVADALLTQTPLVDALLTPNVAVIVGLELEADDVSTFGGVDVFAFYFDRFRLFIFFLVMKAKHLKGTSVHIPKLVLVEESFKGVFQLKGV